jgi:hypothetical protein
MEMEMEMGSIQTRDGGCPTASGSRYLLFTVTVHCSTLHAMECHLQLVDSGCAVLHLGHRMLKCWDRNTDLTEIYRRNKHGGKKKQ